MFLGIDFSGGAASWKAQCSRPSVWIAWVADGRLVDLKPVQALPGTAHPFDRLTALLCAGDYRAAAIDAPFSIPAPHLPPGGHDALLAAVAALPDQPGKRFPAGADLLALAVARAPLAGPKPLRTTERRWAGQGINTRSTLWNGPRGGAPFTAACLALLARAGRPVWPWQRGPGMIAEAFPAAQLRIWGLPHTGYARPDQRAARALILAAIGRRLAISDHHRETMLASADALDAVLAAFGAIAAAASSVADPPPDGLIAVLDAGVPPGDSGTAGQGSG